jgi:hypothetical protein
MKPTELSEAGRCFTIAFQVRFKARIWKLQENLEILELN